ncbi:MAG: serine/threonine protein phosphatase PrpC [Arenicella sp.]|jgi:serine/threonine protein phosphatase PrpC
MEFSVAQQSVQGGRAYNEDRTAIFQRKDALLIIVADGLGGHAGGAIAAQAFIDALGASFAKATGDQLEDAENFLSLSINYAHHMIHRRAVTQGFDSDSPKTTCVVCLIYHGVAQWAHAGDSRLYLIRDNKIVSQTEDHVPHRANSRSSAINRCVGGVESPRPALSNRCHIDEGDIFVLASDGAWHTFKTSDLHDYVDPKQPTLGLDTLLQTLENRNKAPSDNLSMIILYWGVEQLDRPADYDARPKATVKPLTTIGSRPESKISVADFDMNELVSTIFEIENFITEIDKKL